MTLFWNILARILALPPVRGLIWLIAKREPYLSIFGVDGRLYMERWWLFNPYEEKGTRRYPRIPFSIRLHLIHLPDEDRALHDHPWSFRTFVLRGGYAQATLARPFANILLAGQSAAMGRGEYHRITHIFGDGAWTLFCTSGEYQSWGFLINGKHVDRHDAGIP